MRTVGRMDGVPLPVARAAVTAWGRAVAVFAFAFSTAAAWVFWPGHVGMPADAPHARIFVLVERVGERPDVAGPELVRSGDLLHVAVVGEPGLFTSLLNLDSRDQLVRIGPRWDDPLTSDPQPLAHRFQADAIPGREQLVVVAGRSPLGDLDAELGRVNAVADLSRAERLERLRDLLIDRFGGGRVALHAGQELRHAD